VKELASSFGVLLAGVFKMENKVTDYHTGSVSSLVRYVMYTFFVINGILPAISLLWNKEVFSLQINWLIYPVFLCSLAVALILRFKTTVEFFGLSLIIIAYGFLTYLNRGDMVLFFRIGFTMLPLSLLPYFEHADERLARIFWLLFSISMAATLYSVYLQLTGEIPYYTTEIVDGVEIGRISGGFAKPTALVTFLFPVYMYGFYERLVKGKLLWGHFICLAVFVFIVVIAHRTTIVAFALIYIFSFAYRYLNALIVWYYKKLIPFWLGIAGFLVVHILYYRFGLVEALRGRLPMWMAHADEFWNGPVLSMLLGQQQTVLNEKWKLLVWSLDEVHNNSFRTIIFFGIVGYFLYCVFLRHIVLYLNQNHDNAKIKFIMFSCFFYFILFAFTNEHTAYPTIIWPTFVWIFLLVGAKENTVLQVPYKYV
jgi:hypothetical protein